MICEHCANDLGDDDTPKFWLMDLNNAEKPYILPFHYCDYCEPGQIRDPGFYYTQETADLALITYLLARN